MTYDEHRIWQSRLIKRKAVKRHRCRGAVVHDPVYKRTSSFTYLLPANSGQDVVVCQKFFVPHWDTPAIALLSKWWRLHNQIMLYHLQINVVNSSLLPQVKFAQQKHVCNFIAQNRDQTGNEDQIHNDYITFSCTLSVTVPVQSTAWKDSPPKTLCQLDKKAEVQLSVWRRSHWTPHRTNQKHVSNFIAQNGDQTGPCIEVLSLQPVSNRSEKRS